MKTIIIPTLVAGILCLSSCDDFLSEYSQDQIVAKEVKDLDEVLLGSGYLQSSIVSSGPSGTRMAGFFNILDDDVNTGKDSDESSTYVAKAWTQSLQTIYGYFGWQQDVGANWDGTVINDDATTWNTLYEHINVVNVILDQIQDLPHDNEKELADFYRVQAEAHFLRGQFYFTLANLYGNMYEKSTADSTLCVPIKLTPNVEFEFHRATVREVYDQIILDLNTAEDYFKKSTKLKDLTYRLHRASIEAVNLLQSRVYLYMQEWDLAAQKAEAVINTTNFYLSSLSALSSSSIFLTDESPEVIFSQGSNNLSPTAIFTARSGDFCVSKELYDLYDDNDRRKSCFFTSYRTDSISSVENDSIALGYKYERSNSLRAHISDAFTLRLSEAYLNRAEALAISGDEGTANSILNNFRLDRIDGYTAQTYSREELVSQIRDERRKEFCFEGHRWFDLRRYAVCEKYPYAKNLVHVYNVCGDYVGVMYSRTLVLPAYDQSYTFAIPKSVLDYFVDGSMPSNPRDEREPIVDEEEESEDGSTDESVADSTYVQ